MRLITNRKYDVRAEAEHDARLGNKIGCGIARRFRATQGELNQRIMLALLSNHDL